MLSVRLLIRVDRVQMLEFCLARGLRKKACYSNSRAAVPPSFLAQSVRSFSQPWSGRVPSAAPISDHAKGEER